MNKFTDTLSVEELLPILNSIDDAVFIDNKDGTSLWCNTAGCELYHITPEDIMGVHVTDLVKHGTFSTSVTNRVIEEKRQVTIIHENREGRRLLITGTPIFDRSGDISKIVTTSRDITELSNLQTQLDRLQSGIEGIPQLTDSDSFIAQSPSMVSVVQLAQRLASIDSTVLITGESGVGKGVIAKFIHNFGSRCNGPFITVNCGAIPENLIESELFGYEKGAFTGSNREGKKGLFEAAQNGTIFLDEISELPMNLQVKLLQVIQDKVITPVGGVKSIPVNARIVSATNRKLSRLVSEGRFREDLYYRLNVVPINVPPLRDRAEDILPLITYTLQKCNAELKEQKAFDAGALTVMMNYRWPGNVRELQNIIERVVITTKEDIIKTENLPAFIIQSAETTSLRNLTKGSLKEALEDAERQVLEESARKHKTTRAIARALDVSQPTIVRKLNKYGITTSDNS